jgi:hypothetical protein
MSSRQLSHTSTGRCAVLVRVFIVSSLGLGYLSFLISTLPLFLVKREAYRSPSNLEVKNGRAIPPLSDTFHGMVLK